MNNDMLKSNGREKSLQLLQQYFGHDQFRGRQGDIIQHVAEGGHAMVIMPTGMGKSLCYQIPALLNDLQSGAIVLVLSPLIALMQDQVQSLLDEELMPPSSIPHWIERSGNPAISVWRAEITVWSM